MPTSNMAGLSDSDFTNFLVDLDLNFPNGINLDQSHQSGLAISSSQHQQNLDPNLISASGDVSQHAALFDFSMPMEVQFSVAQDGHPASSQAIIPPTPNSVEMHSNAARYLQQYEAHRVMMEQYQLKQHEANSFTPLVSPVVAAHDGQYDMPLCYTVPGAYLSPLTSPAIEGQQHPYHATASASSAATASPVDLDIDMQDNHLRTPPLTKPSRKRQSAPRSATALKELTDSPRSKHQARRKAGHKPSRSEKNAGFQINRQLKSQAWGPSPNFTDTQHRSEDSISPEPLGEPMGPPQKPASTTASPAILAKNQSKGQAGMPATPASYLKIQQPQSSSPRPSPQAAGRTKSVDTQQSVLTPLSLPEAAATLLSIDHGPATSRKTLKLGPLSTPSGSATPSATLAMTTPTSTLNSPLSSALPGATKKHDGRTRAGKKRGSISSTALVSPALRPKISISPNIKPNVPEAGTMNETDAHTMFLASRSNYQNLIEGTHVPGVSYPQELSSNLTSKRTSHKIAEQGRRNRINVALQEMLRLLPKNMSRGDQSPREDEGSSSSGKKKEKEDDGSGGKKKEKDDAGGKGNGNSKASTVESAIEYIQTLQKEHEEMKSAKEKRERENETLRKRLEDMERKLIANGLLQDADGKFPEDKSS